MTIYTTRNDISSYSGVKRAQPLFVDALTSPHSARPKHWPQRAVLVLPRKAATHWVQSAEKSHTHSPQKHYLVYIDNKVKRLSWSKPVILELRSLRDRTATFVSFQQNRTFTPNDLDIGILKNIFNASVNPISGNDEHKSRVQETGHSKAYSAKSIYEQLEHNFKD